MTLFLTETDVENLLTMTDAIRLVEEALRELGTGNAVNRPRQRVRVPHGILHLMPAGLSGRGYVGFKYYTSFSPKTRFWFHLVDADNGDVLSIMQADRLGQRRTGAASGVATRYLAHPDATTVGILGTGWQAESQLEAICVVRDIRLVRCYSPNSEHRKVFAKKVSARLNVDVRGVDSATEAVSEADIIVTATGAREPVLNGIWVAPGTHINAIGSNRVESRELDDEVIVRSSFICVDSLEQARIEAGDLISPVEQGTLQWASVHELSEVVTGQVQGRENPGAVTLFKSMGIALEDVAVGAWVYERAREHGLGKEITL
jgi:alanine dehydrogenase